MKVESDIIATASIELFVLKSRIPMLEVRVGKELGKPGAICIQSEF